MAKSKSTPEWLAHILSGNAYKKNILYNTHPDLNEGSNVWDDVRRTLLNEYGLKDDPNSKYTRFIVPADKVDELKDLVKTPITYKTDPDFSVNYLKDKPVDMRLIERPLFGRRILHVLSPLRWDGKTDHAWFLHESDSNFKAMWKTVNHFPECHHYILVPLYHDIPDDRDNVTLWRFPYATSVYRHRTEFNAKVLRRYFDVRGMDIDFVFCHQPELLGNIKSSMCTSRYGFKMHYFSFFHWVDSKKSRHTNTARTLVRQLEAIMDGDYFFFHTDWSSHFIKINKDREVIEYVLEKYHNKMRYMPLGVDRWPDPEPIPLPRNKKILLFNHRWNKTTGITKMLNWTKELGDDYVIWITDPNARKSKPVLRELDRLHVQYISDIAEYRYLIENSYAAICFVDDYATWNLSVQDGISLNVPTLVYRNPENFVMDEIIGKDYPLYFKTKTEFLEKLNNLPSNFKWELPEHDKHFLTHLSAAMRDCIGSGKSK